MKDEQLSSAIRDVLQKMARQDGEAVYLNAYQILAALDDDLQEKPRAEYGRGGKYAGQQYTAVTRISQVANAIPGVERTWVSTAGMQFPMDIEPVAGGSPVARAYRLC